MRRKDFFFCIIIYGVALLVKVLIPYLFFSSDQRDETTYRATIILLSAILVIAGYWLARKKHLLDIGGFRNPVSANYWMLLLPVLYPGLVLSLDIKGSCFGYWWQTLLLFVSSLLPAMMEEVIGRGIVLGYLRRQYPGKPDFFPVVWSAILFSLAHLTNLISTHPISVTPQLVYALCMGIIFGALLIRVRNVWLLGLAHGCINFLSRICREDSAGTENGFALTDYFIQAGGMALMLSPVLLMSWILVKTKPATNKQLNGPS